MAADSPTILATSGGYKPGARTRLEFNKLVHHAVDLSGVTGRAPRVAHVGAASGDQRWFNNGISEAGNVAGFRLTHLNLFTMPNVGTVEEYPLGQDVVWGNGGSVLNLLAVWRAHGLDAIFRRLSRRSARGAARAHRAIGAEVDLRCAVCGPGDSAA